MFPSVDVRSDHDLVILSNRLRFKKTKKICVKFSFDCLKDPTIYESFQANISRKIALLLLLGEDAEMLMTNFN